MEKGVLLICNRNDEISKKILILQEIFQELDYGGVWILDKNEASFDLELEDFIDKAKKSIECKAALIYDPIEIKRLSKEDFLYCFLLFEHPRQYGESLQMVNNNCVVFSFDKEYLDYIKLNYPNVSNVVYVPFSNEMDEEKWLFFLTQIALEIQERVSIKQGDASILKLLIQRELSAGNLEKSHLYIAKYRRINPQDIDLIAMETIYHLSENNLNLALKYALEGVKRYPCNGEMYYNLASVYERQEDYYNAFVNYGKASTVYFFTKNPKLEKLNVFQCVSNCREKYERYMDRNEYKTYDEMLIDAFGLVVGAFRNYQQVIGNYFWESETEKRYVGIYRDSLLRWQAGNEDLIHMKGEFLKVIEGKEYTIEKGNTEVLLPIAVENSETIHRIQVGEKNYVIEQAYSKHFNYYRLPAGSIVYSSKKAYYGKPIPLCQKKDKKKLVLNIFVDGLSQCILDGKKFESNMPYTASFFKKGVVCSNAYSTAEWTYPSIVNYVTGLDTTHHMLFHNVLDGVIPKEIPTLAEYFHDKGYFTSTIGGNWRAIPNYGHARGYDQFVYQNEWTGFKAEMMVGNVIDHIEAFKETNQFLWITIGDLHDISDEIDLPNSVQSSMKIEECIQKKHGSTSVKQEFSELKIIAYEKMAKRIDVLLNILYLYLEKNYNEEDIIVSLFADHGQGYLVPDSEHFMSRGRSNVAFMFREAGLKPQECDEIISTSDYIKIMCKLADIKMKEVEIDGKLPKVFGGEGREYALSESIHPNDPYYAAIYSKDENFFFGNPFPVLDDGRFYLKKYRAWLTDKQGNRIVNEEKYNLYLDIIMEHIKPLLIYD